MRKITCILTLLIGMLFLAKPVQAGFGVSPSNIYHEYLKPGGHFEQRITLSRSDPDQDLEIIVEPALEEMRNWFSFDPGMKFTFPKGQNRMVLTAIVDVPSDASYKSYQGIIRIKAMTADGEPGGVAVVKGARVDVELVTTKINVTQLEVKQMKMKDVSGDDKLQLEIEVLNKGNTEVSPAARVKIMNLQMQLLEELEDTDIGIIKPNETKIMVAEFDTNLGLGEYFAEAAVLGEGVVARRERLVFRIAERPNISEVVIKQSGWESLTNLIQNKQYVMRVLAEVALAALIVNLVWHGKKWRAAISVLMKTKSALMLKILVGIMAVLGLVWGARQLSGVRQQQKAVVSEEKPAEKPWIDQNGLKVTTGDGWVEGAAIEDDVVATKDEDQTYPLYSEPDATSWVMYYAHEGEEFAVLEERAEWYRVVLPDSTSGWLAKTSVKQATVEPR